MHIAGTGLPSPGLVEWSDINTVHTSSFGLPWLAPVAMTGGLTPADTSTPAVIHLIEDSQGMNFHHEVSRTESPTLF